MPPKPKAPDNLQELIKNLISIAFPELPNNVARSIKVYVSEYGNVDYQFYIKRISANQRITNQDVADRIKEKTVGNDPNQLITKMELSDNQSFLNIFTKVPRTKPCKACHHGIKLGRQGFEFRPTDPKLSEWLNEEYIRDRLSSISLANDNYEPPPKKRKETTSKEIITENFKVHLGADQFVDDIGKAVKDIADINRDG